MWLGRNSDMATFINNLEMLNNQIKELGSRPFSKGHAHFQNDEQSPYHLRHIPDCVENCDSCSTNFDQPIDMAP